MYITIGNTNYEVVIERKRIKHFYLRVKEDLKIYVSASKYISEREIERILQKEFSKIEIMIDKQAQKIEAGYMLLGQPLDIVIVSNLKHPELYQNKLLIGDKAKVDQYLKKIAFSIFQERLTYNYQLFEEKIPFPKLKVRKMQTRWGVCNRKYNTITLNLELLKKETKYIDYVIMHELCHFIWFNHSKSFWNLVSKYVKDYHIIRKELRE
jgi:predicted metal-dependent hydrolase